MSPLRVPVLGVFDFVRSNSRRHPALATCQGRTCLHAPRPLLSPESSPPRQLTQRGSCARSALKRRRRRDTGRPGWRRLACNGRRELRDSTRAASLDRRPTELRDRQGRTKVSKCQRPAGTRGHAQATGSIQMHSQKKLVHLRCLSKHYTVYLQSALPRRLLVS